MHRAFLFGASTIHEFLKDDIYLREMTPFPYSTIDLTSEQIDTILSIFNSLQKEYSVDFKMDFTFSFKNFALFNNYETCSAGPVIEIKEGALPYFVIFAQLFYTYHSASRRGVHIANEYQTWCAYPLQRDYGHILIKSETLLDKIHEFVHRLKLILKMMLVSVIDIMYWPAMKTLHVHF